MRGKQTVAAIICLAVILITPSYIGNAKKIDISHMPLPQLREAILQNNGQLPPELISRPHKQFRSVGTQKILVLPLMFEDLKPVLSLDIIRDIMLTGKNSIDKFYQASSYGKSFVSFGKPQVPDWMMMPSSLFSYSDIEDLFKDGLETAKENGIDFTEFDEDENGYPDLVIFLWPGVSYTCGGYMPGNFSVDLDNYTAISCCEDAGESRSSFPVIVMYHEIFHGMGDLFDLYDYNYKNVNAGGWDLMGEGVYMGYCGLSAFSRWKAGWLDIETIDKPGTYMVDDLNGDGQHKAYRINMPGSKTEWLLVENRQKAGGDSFHQGIPNQGLVFWHVDDSRPYEHRFNTTKGALITPGICVLCPEPGDFYKQNSAYGSNYSRTSLTFQTPAKPLPYNLDPTAPMIKITNISKSGATMTFDLDYERPIKSVLVTQKEVSFGKVRKGDTVASSINFKNAGRGNLVVRLNVYDTDWLKIDRNSFIGNDEDIIMTCNTKRLEIGTHKGSIEYSGKDVDGSVRVKVEVIPELGDINADGYVNSKDIELMEKVFGKTKDNLKFDPKCDLNEDGIIDGFDLIILAKHIPITT